MQFDEFLAHELARDTGQPTVRVYGWQPHAVSLGYNQDENDIDIERCRIDGIDIVRRPTGGRAILHAHELTYSVVMYAEGRNIAQVYEQIGGAIVAALHHLGVKAEMSRNVLNFPELYSARRDSISCFTSISRSEIQHRGKKIVGSAQRRFGDVVLQHGSVLLGPQHRNLSTYIRCSNPHDRETMDSMMKEKTTEVESVLGRNVSFEEAADAMRKGFEEAWNITLVDQDQQYLQETLRLP